MIKSKRGASSRLEQVAGKSLFDMYFMTSDKPVPVMKDQLANALNETHGLNYQRKHVDNWVAGRVKTPIIAEIYMREQVLSYVYGDEVVWALRNLL